MKKAIILAALLAATAWSLHSEENEEFTWAKFEQLVAVQTDGKTPYELVEKYYPELSEDEIPMKVQEIYEWYYNHPTELIITQEEDYGTNSKDS